MEQVLFFYAACASVMKIEQVHFHYSRLLRIFVAARHIYCSASAIANKLALLSASAYICRCAPHILLRLGNEN